MIITLMAALDVDGAIGAASGGLPWHLPDEVAHFRASCRSQWMLLGRRTFEEMAGWFTDQTPLVLTSRPAVPFVNTSPIPARPVTSVAGALALARAGGAPALIVAGGAAAFAAALPAATRLALSRVGHRSGGTVFFPSVDWTHWQPVRPFPALVDAATGIHITLETWERIPSPQPVPNWPGA